MRVLGLRISIQRFYLRKCKLTDSAGIMAAMVIILPLILALPATSPMFARGAIGRNGSLPTNAVRWESGAREALRNALEALLEGGSCRNLLTS